MPVGCGKSQEVGGADDEENDANGKREVCATGVMNHDGRGKLIAAAASFQPAAAGGQNILRPLRFLAVGEGDHETIGCSKDIYRRAVGSP